ncbi:hypothetical protein C8A00DRAFT_16590 [Chaetomidium leptoderma]|uniref:Uncharacterized protein n=1 Tax=Chaetomidium leptoderma TaxID=669021 RepID=A0AAN6VIC3_9PEZI|nr:hypothetical protein C8A00DRAFT_16590 [Chaetomidium leptoderma]
MVAPKLSGKGGNDRRHPVHSFFRPGFDGRAKVVDVSVLYAGDLLEQAAFDLLVNLVDELTEVATANSLILETELHDGFSDAELVQYMKQNRRDDGGFDLEFDGWENLAKEQRDQLAQRLKDGALQANDETKSRPADLDVVAARLREIDNHQDTLPPVASRSPRYDRSPTPIYDEVAETKKSEMVAYHDLIKDGGRPLYPISLLEEVLNDPEGHREMLLPWQPYPNPSIPKWNVFREQLWSWRAFRNWQKDNREYNEEEKFAAFVEEGEHKEAESTANEWAKWAHPGMTESQYLKSLRVQFERRQTENGADDEEEGFSAFLEETKRRNLEAGYMWPGMAEDEYRRVLRGEFNARQKKLRDLFRDYFYWLREDHGRGGFPEYVAEAKRRLAKHGFTRTSQLDKDPTRQDKLTTWIEYLNYEYSWHDRYERSIKRLRPKYNEAWKKLADSGVLRPGETDETLGTIESAFRRQGEKDQAGEAVASAEAAAKAAVSETEKAKTGRSSFTEQQRTRRLAAAHYRLVAAKEALKTIKRRGDLITEFIRETWDYPEEKRNLHRQRLLLQWILEQVPLIEAELNEPKVAGGGSRAGRGAKRGRLYQDAEVTDDRRPTKRKRGESSSLANDTGPSAQARKPSKRGRRDGTGHERPSKRLRNDGQDSTPRDAVAVEISDVPKNRPLRSTEMSRSRAISQQPLLEKSTDAFTKDNASQTLLRASNGDGAVQLRRSARIAARQDPSGSAVAHPRITENVRQRSRRKVAQERTPLHPQGRKSVNRCR